MHQPHLLSGRDPNVTVFSVTQKTEYRYEVAARQSIGQCRMQPLEGGGQHLEAYAFEVTPKARCYPFGDYWGNTAVTFYHFNAHRRLCIETEAVVRVDRAHLADGTRFHGALAGMGTQEFKNRFAEYLARTAYTSVPEDVLADLSEDVWRGSDDIFSFALAMTERLYWDFSYEKDETTVETTAAEFAIRKKGVCQDFAHLMLALARCRGIPARYVSGYIYCGEDAALRGDSATHAWAELLMPGEVWVGFDPTNNQRVLDGYVAVAVGRDYSDIVPSKGVHLGGGRQELSVEVRMRRET